MVKLLKYILALFVSTSFFCQEGYCQLDIYSEVSAYDNFRLKQLLVDSPYCKSYTLRSSSSFFSSGSPFVENNNSLLRHKNGFIDKKAYFKLNNIGWEINSNDHLGFSSNDGSMLPSVGLQHRAHINMQARWGKFQLQLAPEYLTAENLSPQPYALDPQDGNFMARYYFYEVNHIDMYSRFGKEKIEKFIPGQSSFTYNTKNFAIGVSTQNIWWGPGVRNGLILSNNATGFAHFSVNTFKPIETKFGSFEGQLIYGNLENSKFENPEHDIMRGIWAGGIAVKDSAKRSIAGLTITWEPKWLKHFYVGVSMAGSSYYNKVDRKLIAFPFSSNYQPIKLGSFFMRYVMPKDNAEIYVELGRADKMLTPFNLFRDSIPLGYVAGIRKLMPIGKTKTNFYFGLEVARLQLPDPRLIFTQGNAYGQPQTNSWYLGKQVLQGYTNNAEVLGAWVGPGGNSQTIQLGFVRGFKKLLFTGERVCHDNDFYYYNYYNGLNINASKFWVDMKFASQLQWDVKDLLISAGASWASLLNYHWIKLDGGFSGPSKLSDRRNAQWCASVAWFFRGLK
jgi:hypothetical protein